MDGLPWLASPFTKIAPHESAAGALTGGTRKSPSQRAALFRASRTARPEAQIASPPLQCPDHLFVGVVVWKSGDVQGCVSLVRPRIAICPGGKQHSNQSSVPVRRGEVERGLAVAQRAPVARDMIHVRAVFNQNLRDLVALNL